jgi:hypothetical protein
MKQKVLPLDIPWQERASFLDKGWMHDLQACQGDTGEIQILYNNLVDASPTKPSKFVFKYPDEFKYPHAITQKVWFRGEGRKAANVISEYGPESLSRKPLKRIDG